MAYRVGATISGKEWIDFHGTSRRDSRRLLEPVAGHVGGRRVADARRVGRRHAADRGDGRAHRRDSVRRHGWPPRWLEVALPRVTAGGPPEGADGGPPEGGRPTVALPEAVPPTAVPTAACGRACHAARRSAARRPVSGIHKAEGVWPADMTGASRWRACGQPATAWPRCSAAPRTRVSVCRAPARPSRARAPARVPPRMRRRPRRPTVSDATLEEHPQRGARAARARERLTRPRG